MTAFCGLYIYTRKSKKNWARPVVLFLIEEINVIGLGPFPFISTDLNHSTSFEDPLSPQCMYILIGGFTTKILENAVNNKELMKEVYET